MSIVKTKVTCRICKKEFLENSFNKHLKSHDDPLSRNCTRWYKDYFKNDSGACVCKICDDELHCEYSYQYLDHLKQHGINEK